MSIQNLCMPKRQCFLQIIFCGSRWLFSEFFNKKYNYLRLFKNYKNTKRQFFLYHQKLPDDDQCYLLNASYVSYVVVLLFHGYPPCVCARGESARARVPRLQPLHPRARAPRRALRAPCAPRAARASRGACGRGWSCIWCACVWRSLSCTGRGWRPCCVCWRTKHQ